MALEAHPVSKLERAGRAWAKSRFGWLSLVDHSIDVAGVGEALIRLPTVTKRLGALAERELSDVDVARLGFFIGFHDVGKANHGFQARLHRRKPDCGHIGPLWSILCSVPVSRSHYLLRKRLHKSLSRSLWRHWLDQEAEVELWNAVLAHHGSLPANRPARPDPKRWHPRNGYNPLGSLAELAQILITMFPEAFDEGYEESIPIAPRFLHALAGLITLADWLGSDHTVFLCPDKTTPSGEARIPWARSRAVELIKRRWIDPTRARNAVSGLSVDFKTLFPDLASPRPAQEELLNSPLPKPGQTIILEAETGSGKTEAALIHFLRLFQAGQVDGLYFALPTRSAAIQIQRRIRTMVQRWFREAAPPVGLAVPGYLLRVDEAKGRRLPETYEVLWPDEADRDRTWAVENAKRYLSGAVMVGTVDQLLMGGLRLRHSSFRSGPMLRLLLCIDEVHASDAYMTTLLRNVLNQHSRSGGHALLMSATLGAQARMRLLADRLEAHKVPSMAKAAALHYPALTRSGGSLRPLVRDGRVKRVAVELINPESDFPDLLNRLRTAAEAGAAVLFIRNRVDDAQATVRYLEEKSALLMRCEGQVAPHHGRYAPEDRRLLDNALENEFSAGERNGVVAVTTQTAEQSLDICADWLVTDIAPGDVLLQRIGRLHRHERVRPIGFERARITVLAPGCDQLAGTLNSRTGNPCARTLLGLGSVYENIVGVLAVREWLAKRLELHIPEDNRALVEASTHPQSLWEYAEQLGGIWPIHLQSVEGQRLAEGMGANTVAIRWDESLLENQPVSDQRAETRLGLRDHRVELPEPRLGPFGHPVRTLSIPGWMVKTGTEDEGVEIIDHRPGVLRFRFKSRDFRYDRYGLSLLRE